MDEKACVKLILHDWLQSKQWRDISRMGEKQAGQWQRKTKQTEYGVNSLNVNTHSPGAKHVGIALHCIYMWTTEFMDFI